MIQEDIQLLLIDLSARFPYHPFVHGKTGYARNDGRLILITSSGCTIMTKGGSHFHYFFNDVKPYLRPMSSMTKEEREEMKKYTIAGGGWTEKGFDWLNKHHFDYRGLIEKGLALEAPEGMYN